MNIIESQYNPDWFWIQKWLDLAKLQRDGKEWN